VTLPRLILTPEAFEDIREARQWYEQRRHGLGAAFELALEAVLTQLQRRPQAAGPSDGVAALAARGDAPLPL